MLVPAEHDDVFALEIDSRRRFTQRIVDVACVAHGLAVENVLAGGRQVFGHHVPLRNGKVRRKKKRRKLIRPNALRNSDGDSFAVIGMAPMILPLMTSMLPSRSSALTCIKSDPSLDFSFICVRPLC